jgi:hypothetical protein
MVNQCSVFSNPKLRDQIKMVKHLFCYLKSVFFICVLPPTKKLNTEHYSAI